MDGMEAPVLRGNGAFRAVRVSAGRHRIDLRYRPPEVLAAAAISLVTVAFGLGVLAFSRRHRRRGVLPRESGRAATGIGLRPLLR